MLIYYYYHLNHFMESCNFSKKKNNQKFAILDDSWMVFFDGYTHMGITFLGLKVWVWDKSKTVKPLHKQ